MHRIDDPDRLVNGNGAGKDGFTEGSPSPLVAATVVTDDWLNDVQENIAQLIESEGITLVKGVFTQLRDAIRARSLSVALSNWTPRTTGATDPFYASVSRAYAGTITLSLVGGSAGAAIIHETSNGISWTADLSTNASLLRAVARSADGIYAVAVGDSGAGSAANTPYSPGPGVWNQGANVGGANASLFAVIAAPASFNPSVYWITCGSGGIIATYDTWFGGPNPWTTRTSSTTNALKSLASDGTTVVAVGVGGTIRTSTNGTTWASPSSGTANDLNKVIWTGTQFVAVGAAGTVLTSPTGTTWTVRTSGTSNALTDIASSTALLVAVGASGTIVTSADGAAWVVRTSGIANPLNGVVITSNGDVVAGSSSLVCVSTDAGATWKTRPSATGVIRCLANFNGTVVVAGDGGNVATAMWT